MQVRGARAGDCATLTAIAHEAKAYWGYRAEELYAWRDELTVAPESLLALATFVARLEGEIAGFFQLSAPADILELEHFWVRPKHMGQGIGRALLALAVREASAAGCRQLHIDADPNAEPFYLACGAVRSGAKPAPIDGQPLRVRPQLVLSASTPECNR